MNLCDLWTIMCGSGVALSGVMPPLQVAEGEYIIYYIYIYIYMYIYTVFSLSCSPGFQGRIASSATAANTGTHGHVSRSEETLCWCRKSALNGGWGAQPSVQHETWTSLCLMSAMAHSLSNMRVWETTLDKVPTHWVFISQGARTNPSWHPQGARTPDTAPSTHRTRRATRAAV